MNSRGGGLGKLSSSFISKEVLTANILLLACRLLTFLVIPFFSGIALNGLTLLVTLVI
jgi:hypothetical protein